MTGMDERHVIEDAIGFLVDAFRVTGKNPKPVIFRSIRVGMRLFDSDTETVVAGIRHDIVEDTVVTMDDVGSRFGDRHERFSRRPAG
jgi:(p)ppGpp synthase/HD superfamily hydrolase